MENFECCICGEMFKMNPTWGVGERIEEFRKMYNREPTEEESSNLVCEACFDKYLKICLN